MSSQIIGKVAMTPRGEYDPSRTYERLDIVRHNGSAYVVLAETIKGVTPVDGQDYMLLVAGGSGGLSSAAANLLLEIMGAAVYTANMSGKINKLRELLASGTPDKPDQPDEPGTPDDEISVSDGVMTISAVYSEITVTDGVMTIN